MSLLVFVSIFAGIAIGIELIYFIFIKKIATKHERETWNRSGEKKEDDPNGKDNHEQT